MKILFVVSGTERVAATRYRVYQYLPFLKSQGIEYSVFSTTSDFITKLSIRSPEFNSVKRLIYYFTLYIERFFRFWAIFMMSGRFDIIFLQRATFPFGLVRLLAARNKNIIFDIDDAIYLADTPVRGWITRLKAYMKEKEVLDSLKVSQSVIVENDYIKKYVSKICGKIYKIPGPIDTDRYFVNKSFQKNKNEIILGWIGSPATTVYLRMWRKVISEILSRFKSVKIVLIGAGNHEFSTDRVIKKEWSYQTEVGELQKFDIGLMPMPDDEWTRGKLGCKMLQYMAVGVPPVVSYTPTNAELIRDSENGFLVKTESEWIRRLSSLIEDETLRRKIGESGRRTVEEMCSVRNNAPKLIKIFEDQIKNANNN
ncbi:glycosyltransferase family 4 protein [Candidatus Omnitrophota bacterium]